MTTGRRRGVASDVCALRRRAAVGSATAVLLLVAQLLTGPGVGALDCGAEEAVVIGEAVVVGETMVVFDVVSLEVVSDQPDRDLVADLRPGSRIEVRYDDGDGTRLEVGERYEIPFYNRIMRSSVPYESSGCDGGTRNTDGSFVIGPPLWSEKGVMRLVPYLAAIAVAVGLVAAVRHRLDSRRTVRRAQAVEARIEEGERVALPGRP